MQFLKKEIFYPDDFMTEESNHLIQEANNAYGKYLEEQQKHFPKSLYSAYMESDFFHDYAVKSIKIDGEAWCYRKKSDVVTLEICDNPIEYTIVFEKISYLKLLNEQRDSCWISLDNDEKYSSSPTNGFEEIVLCEICVLENKRLSFEFLTSSGAIFEVHFQSVKIKKRKSYV